MIISTIKDILYQIVKLEQLILNPTSLHQPYCKPIQTYKYLISVGGFGYSGHSALLDFFSEFENVTTLRSNKGHYQEADFLRSAGGLTSIENIIETNNRFIMDMMIKNFITFSEFNWSTGGIYTDKYIKLTSDFINQIVDFKTKTSRYTNDFCPALSFHCYKNLRDWKNRNSPFIINPNKERSTYHIKRLSKKEYREIAKEYTINVLNTIDSKPYLFLNHLISDGNTDLDYHKEYCGDIKEIMVFRDPRDVYIEGVKKNIPWIPHNPKDYIEWYRSDLSRYIQNTHPDRMMIRFEDLVYDYPNISKQIIDFIGLKPEWHKEKRQYFNPDISIKNIGIYKEYSNQNIITEIEENLKEYCYYPDTTLSSSQSLHQT